MYLAEMSKDQKLSFMSLAFALVKADGSYDQTEKAMIDEYMKEMNIGDADIAQLNKPDFALSLLSQSSTTDKRKLFFELIALAYADSTIADEEGELLQVIKDKFEISDELFDEFEAISKTLLTTYARIGQLIYE